MQMIDLAHHVNECSRRLEARLRELSDYVRSLHLAIVNYNPDKAQKQTFLFGLGAPEEGSSDRDGYPLADGTDRFAMRMCLFAMCEVLEAGLREILLPYQVICHTPVTACGIVRADWERALEIERKRLQKKTFGNLIKLIDAALKELPVADRVDGWQEISPKLEQYRGLRNCIGHRLGHVSALDVPQGEEALTFRWIGLHLAVDGIKVAGAPFSVRAGQEVSLIKRTHTASWSEGDTVALVPEQVLALPFDVILLMRKVGPMVARAAVIKFDTRVGRARSTD